MPGIGKFIMMMNKGGGGPPVGTITNYGTFTGNTGESCIVYDGTLMWIMPWNNNIYTIDSAGTITSKSAITDISVPISGVLMGGYLYIANNSNNKVVKVDPATGTKVWSATCASGGNCREICTDGTYVYVAEQGTGHISKIDSSGTVTDIVVTGASDLRQIAWDNANARLWVGCVGTGKLFKLDNTGGNQASFSLSLNPAGLNHSMMHDGTYLWQVDYASTSIRKIDHTGSVVATYTLSAGGTGSIYWDAVGGNLWGSQITATGFDTWYCTPSGTITTYSTGNVGSCAGMTGDGSHYAWYAGYTSGKVSKIRMN